MDVDIVCVGFGPATGGFLTTLTRGMLNPDGTPKLESQAAPGLPPQVICYERADDIGFGVSGVVTRARGIRASYPELDPRQIPMASPVTSEKVVYLLDPVGASRRPWAMRVADHCFRTFKGLLPYHAEAVELPWTPSFMHKHDGWVCSLGQFNQWVGSQLMGSGAVQIWPATPVAQAILQDGRVAGVQLMDQGTDKSGQPAEGYLPGAEVRAALTVVGDGPVGAIGQQLDQAFGLPEGHALRDWAVGMKFVVELPEQTQLSPGTVIHTLGFPEPEIFGFLYVHPDRVASLGIFVPSWFDSPVRTAYRYLQHWMLHPYLWQHLKGAQLRSWGAKTLQESGRRGEPRLVGDGYARIGEGSGSTNVLTGSGVDEAWSTGVQLGESVLELLEQRKPFTRENLEATYVRRRRASWVESEGRVAERSRDGFHRGVITGLIGMALTGMTGGRFFLRGKPLLPHERYKSLESFYRDKLPAARIRQILEDCRARNIPAHAALMDAVGWPAIPYDGRLMLTQQDALLIGGKVQAPPGYADHVVFLYPSICATCGPQVCVEACSGQAITPGENGVPQFDREKCVHCGACLWNCSRPIRPGSTRTNLAFRAGAGGLHSAEN
ncbi:MAG: 4Fe-4S ferredoxin [Verrucomicrobia bacterium]|nr:4Fe-4S ferredoxin [Verrucomicrobiota bacterium]